MNLRITVFAALLCGVASMTAAQTVTCTGCTHVVPVYMGEGGLIATAGEDAKMVDVVATCGNVTTSNELKPDDDGKIALLFAGDLACAAGGSLEIGPVMDGGWYWITDEMSSAVGQLVAKDVLMNDRVKLTGAGEGVTMSFPGDDKKDAEDKGAQLVKESSTGRIGILPTILPEPPVEPAAPCGARLISATRGYARVTSDCMMGDGGTALRVQGPVNAFTGKRATGNRIVRPAAGTVDVKIDLWGNGTGHFLTSAAATTDSAATGAAARPGYNFLRGHEGGAPLELTSAGTNNDPVTGGGIAAGLGGVTSTPLVAADDNTNPTNSVGGMNFAVTGNVGTLTIRPDSAYCAPTAKPPKNNVATVNVSAYVATTLQSQVTPAIAVPGALAGANANRAAVATITVVCPSAAASAHLGRDLVPENPFPVD